jgi:hypothetical protein
MHSPKYDEKSLLSQQASFAGSKHCYPISWVNINEFQHQWQMQLQGFARDLTVLLMIYS